ncbi:MAG TPA: FAD-dependent oxidoreductase [Solirubrobacteraceae bacterium]|jgi:3-phenylpropionate/trans-cinnamate dioxygenase ferredoxin reductase subunit
MSTEQPRRIVIVGAGHGGGTAASLLRQHGFAGEVILIGAEPVGPYHRPPLSKSLMKGELEQPLLPQAFYREQGIELRVGVGVASIDRQAHELRLHSGESLAYDVLILATGAKARRLPVPGIELEKVYELRTIANARVLHDVLTPNRHLAIVGGGWIGLEVAASAVAAGVQVTVIEREERLLARVASPELSRHLTDYHLRQGTKLLTSAQVAGIEGNARGAVHAVKLEDGQTIACDRVLIGVGAVADDELAKAAGLRCEDGVVVDSRGRTDDSSVFAIGDMTRRPVALHDGLLRVESIPSALEQARQAVAYILGQPEPAPEVPWFWSDQFDLKLQIAGLLRGSDGSVVRADPDANKLAIFHLRGGRLIAVEGVNAAAEFMIGKALIRDQVALDLERLADPQTPLDQVARGDVARGDAPTPSADVIASAEPAATSEPPGPGGKAGEPLVSFIQPDGELASVNIPVGRSLMEGSVRNNLPGIIAECGGMCSCGTCHVYIDPEWEGLLPEPEYEEADLLEFLEGAEPNSRLSCQLVMTDELDGMVVRVATFS